MIDSFKEKIRNLLIIFGIKKSKTGRYIVSKTSNWIVKPWIYLLYVSDYDRNNVECRHQNVRETREMVRIMNECGYNVFVHDWSKKPYFPLINVKVIIGIAPYFEDVCKRYPNAKKIYFATGAYYLHQNMQIKYMTNWVNAKYNTNIPYVRLIEPHHAIEVCDLILMIGSKYSKATYPQFCQNKIHIINQSSLVQNCNYTKQTMKLGKRKEYLFIASTGNVLRGVPLLIDYFTQHSDFILHWIGDLDEDFKEIIDGGKIPSNIIRYGVLEMNSHKMHSIVSQVNFILYPSGSEGGAPGSVINAMQYGLIPLVTPWSAFNEIDEYGYMMNDWSIDAIQKAITWAESLTNSDIEKRRLAVHNFAQKEWSLSRYSKEFMDYMTNFVCK